MTAEKYVTRISRLRLPSVTAAAAMALSLILGAASSVNAQDTDTWKVTTGSMAVGGDRRHATVTKLLDGRVLIAGGNSAGSPGSAAYNTAYLYDPSTETFTQTPGNMVVGRTLHTATLLPNGKVLIVGGWAPGNLASAELFDPLSGTFSATDSMDLARSQHAATRLQDGRVLISGGYDATLDDATNTAEIYNPATGLFTPSGTLVAKRNTHTATLLNNGKVLLAGGVGALPLIATAEIFDPAAGTFAATVNTMAVPRAAHSATLLSSGRVLIFGGDATTTSKETFDPVTGTFGNFTTLTNPNFFWNTGTSLPNDTALVAGGANSTPAWDAGSAAELDSSYQTPTTNSLPMTMPLPGQWGGGAVALANGRILVAGGGTANGHLFCPSNKPFALLPIPEQTVNEGQLLTLTLKSNLCDDQSLAFFDIFVEDMPEGALFDAESATLTWTPNSAQAGTYFVTVLVSQCFEGPCGGFLDSKQFKIVVNEQIADADGDGIPDDVDNCPSVPNPDQADQDGGVGDGPVALGDVCDPTPIGDEFANKVTTTTAVAPAPPGGYTTDPNAPITITGTVTFNPATDPYYAVTPNAANLIPRVTLRTTGQVFEPDRVPEGLAISFFETAPGVPGPGLALIDVSAQTFTAQINLRDFYASAFSLPPGDYDVVLEYVSFVRDPDVLPDGTCKLGSECFSPVWAGIVPAAAKTLRIGVDVPGGTGLLDDLIRKVQALQLDNKTKNGLLSKLLDAKQLLAKKNITGVCGKLNDFIQAVQAQSGKNLTPGKADELIADARAIRTLLGCK